MKGNCHGRPVLLLRYEEDAVNITFNFKSHLWADDEHSLCSHDLFCQPAHGPQLCDLPLLPHVDSHAAAAVPVQELC